MPVTDGFSSIAISQSPHFLHSKGSKLHSYEVKTQGVALYNFLGRDHRGRLPSKGDQGPTSPLRGSNRAETTAWYGEVTSGFQKEKERLSHYNGGLEARDQNILQRQDLPPTSNARSTLVRGTEERGGQGRKAQ